MDNSPLNDVPGEIRNLVYQYTFTSSAPIRLTATDRDADSKFRLSPESRHRIALLRVCKQIRTESISLFYSSVTFRIVPDSFEHLVQLPAALLASFNTQRRRQIRELQVLASERLTMEVFSNVQATHERLLPSMVQMFYATRNLPQCDVSYLFYNEVTGRILKRHQLLSYLSFNLKDSRTLWTAQKDAVYHQAREWVRYQSHSKGDTARMCVMMVRRIRVLQAELQIVIEGGQ